MRALSNTIINAAQQVGMQVLLAREFIESGVAYNPTSSSVRRHPYDVYEKLRRRDPIHRMRLLNAWALVRYEDIDAILRNHHQFICSDRMIDYSTIQTLLDYDPPQHTRIRSLVSKAFTARALNELAPVIEQTVLDLVDDIGDAKKIDLIDAIAYPLPVLVIAKMLGVPSSDLERFRKWSDMIALGIEPILSSIEVTQLEQGTGELIEYFEEQIEERKHSPKDDILGTLIKAEEDGDRLSRDELMGTLVLLLVAGNETTRNLIGNGMLALLSNPEQMQWLIDNLDQMNSAVKELLRYDSPVQIDSRMAKNDLEIDGRKIKAGDKLLLLIGAANRDPTVYANPNQLNLERKGKPNLSFGRGIHYCLGAVLAMIEARIVFEVLLTKFPRMKLASKPKYRERVVLRGLKELWIDLD